MEVVQRYTWEDTLIEAQVKGLLPNGALLVALKLARAINWVPSDGRPSGLYWKNETALEAVGASRANFYKHRPILFELGFFTMVKGNLIPQVPDLSPTETEESLVETAQSPVETQESPVDNPYSEDTYIDDLLSEVIKEGNQMIQSEKSGEPVSTPLTVRTTGSLNEVEEVPEVSTRDSFPTSSVEHFRQMRRSRGEPKLRDPGPEVW